MRGMYSPKDPKLLQHSDAPVYDFFMYRVQNDEDYEPKNQNMANLAGAMFYLHNEIIWHVPRRFNKTRIQKFRVHTKAPQPLFEKGMNFGTRVAFDLGMCTGPFNCDDWWAKYGYYVGCNNVGSFPTSQWKDTCRYAGAVWYSLPGPCPSQHYNNQSLICRGHEPGGACPPGVIPTGEGNCTYSYQLVGEISLNELSGIDTDYDSFIKKGGREYNKWSDQGVLTDFWNWKWSHHVCDARVEKANEMFRKKYPDDPNEKDLPSPVCDFNYGSFYG